MLEALQIAGRAAQYAGLLVLFGASAFSLYSPDAAGFLPLRRLLGAAAIASLIACFIGLIGQTGAMAGSLTDAVNPDMLWTIVSATHFGAAWTVRVGVLVLAAVSIAFTAGRPRTASVLTLILSGVAAATLAWGGHAVEGEGPAGLAHLSADIAHIGAAGLWVGALVCFSLLALRRGADHLEATAEALAGFAGAGSAIVAALVLTGLINTAFMTPLASIPSLPGNAWAQVLAVKLALFAGMVAFAATNRLVLTPRLARSLADPALQAQAVQSLKRSLFGETALAFAVLGLVAWLGTLHPPLHG